jgi:hypothetical protein
MSASDDDRDTSASSSETTTIKFNSTGKTTIMQHLSPDHTTYPKVARADVQEEIIFTADEIERLLAIVDEVHSTNTHWINMAARIQGAAKRVGVY